MSSLVKEMIMNNKMENCQKNGILSNFAPNLCRLLEYDMV